MTEAAITVDNQQAYDGVYGLIRRLGDRVPSTVAERNAVMWRAVDEVLKVVRDPEAAEELAAFRDGYLQLCWDQHTEHSPHQTSYDHADEPVTQVQYTYDGRPAWHCVSCLRVTLASDDDVDVCRGCGADDLRALFYETPCTIEDHQG